MTKEKLLPTNSLAFGEYEQAQAAPVKKVKKPVDIIYGVDEIPPFRVLVPLVVQQIINLSVDLMFPVLIVAAIGGPTVMAQSLVSLMMVSMGIGTIMQAYNKGPVGSGYFCAQETNALLFPVSVLAVKTGGFHLMLGMTVVAGVAQVLFSRVVHKLRILFPVEITGLIIMMLSISLIKYAFFSFAGDGKGFDGLEAIIAFATLGVMMFVHVWGKENMRQYSVIAGVVAGLLIAYCTGILTDEHLAKIAAAPVMALPSMEHVGWSFNIDLLFPFLLVAFCSSIKTVGNITTCQKVSDANWLRPDMKSIGGGLFAEGLGTIISGLCGTMGQTTSSSSMGIAIATGSLSRCIGCFVGLAFIVLAFFPKVAAVFAIMPEAVMAAVLMMAIIFVIPTGMQICTSRLLNPRRSFVVGLAFVVGMAVEMFPGFEASFPVCLQPIFKSSLAAAATTAILLNLLFRLGIAKHQFFMIRPGVTSSEEIADFMEAKGASWGARREIIQRAAAAVNEFMESAVNLALTEQKIKVDVSFEEFNLDIDIYYQGVLMVFPERRPTAAELLQDERAILKLSGFLVKKHVDWLKAENSNGVSHLRFHFDH